MSDQVETPVSEADAALEKAFDAVVPLIKDGQISWKDLAQRLRPEPEIIKAPEKLPIARLVSDKLKLQVAKLPSVFGKVAPDKVRKLEVEEVTALLDERDVLDDIAVEMEKRKEDIRTIVLNHFDAKIREERCLDTDDLGYMCWKKKGHADLVAGKSEDEVRAMLDGADVATVEALLNADHKHQFVPLDKDGHFIPVEEKGKLTEHDGKSPKQFSWERREASKSSISPAMLEALAEDPECDFITHDEYIAMTTQKRVFDEDKAMKAIVKNPRLLKAISMATQGGTVGAQFWTRKV